MTKSEARILSVAVRASAGHLPWAPMARWTRVAVRRFSPLVIPARPFAPVSQSPGLSASPSFPCRSGTKTAFSFVSRRWIIPA